MSVEIEISTEALKAYARTNDAIEAFNMTVANGQTRLALQVLVDIVNVLVDKIEELEDKINLSTKNDVIDSTVEKEEIKVEEIKSETKVVKEKTEDKTQV